MRPNELYLADIIEAVDAIDRFLAGKTRKKFLVDEVLQSAVLQKLIVIGEAASRLSPELHADYPDVEWADIVGLRNIAVHAYFKVDWSIIWVAAKKDAPMLRGKIMRILKAANK